MAQDMHVCMIKNPLDRMSDTTDSIAGADRCDQFVDDGSDGILLMHKGAKLEAVSTTDENLTDPEYTMQIGNTTEQMNRSFRCQYDSSTLSKFPESLKVAFPESMRITSTELECDIDTVMLKNQLDVMQGELGELNQLKCSDAAYRCRMPRAPSTSSPCVSHEEEEQYDRKHRTL